MDSRRTLHIPFMRRTDAIRTSTRSRYVLHIGLKRTYLEVCGKFRLCRILVNHNNSWMFIEQCCHQNTDQVGHRKRSSRRFHVLAKFSLARRIEVIAVLWLALKKCKLNLDWAVKNTSSVGGRPIFDRKQPWVQFKFRLPECKFKKNERQGKKSPNSFISRRALTLYKSKRVGAKKGDVFAER